ncbi:V-set domain-containing T-cell activation inhibitor 1-like [Solea solea]|uniref:V-set domain-containing T-cell activation inhibitor 1-like n=1 Tax=Solea solea TaxID=90069 RepID=UPI002729D578|nr:V-set domain-containing T-cell activation inhibitor 1-like [Solea solea]
MTELKFTLPPPMSTMVAHTGLLLCSLLLIVSATEKNEFTITCQTSTDCVLPCRFQSDGKGARIMWYKKKAVVSCTRYGNTSFVVGHNSPADKYRGRTGLFADQVLEGNATLLLKNVTPHDEGRYYCITMTAPRTDESGIIALVIEGPVREVDVELSGKVVICAAEGIYPAPTLTWSTDPPTDVQLLKSKTNTHKNKLGIYDIHSSLKLTTNIRGHTYICSVANDVNNKTVFLKHEDSVVAPGYGRVTIFCSLPYTALQSYNLTWIFGRSEAIALMRVVDENSQVEIQDQWRHYVAGNVSFLDGLQLQSLTPEHKGNYTCVVSTPDKTYITWTNVTIIEEPIQYMYIFIIIGLIMALGLSYVGFGCKIRKLKRAREESTEAIMENLRTAQDNDIWATNVADAADATGAADTADAENAREEGDE